MGKWETKIDHMMGKGWEKDGENLEMMEKIGKLGKRLGKSLEAYGKMIGR